MRHGWSTWAVALGVSTLLSAAPLAQAQTVTTERQTVNPQPTTTTTVQPVQTVPVQPVQAAPVAQAAPASTTNKTVVAEQHDQGSFMGTVAKDTFFGALTGALVGGAIYFIGGRDTAPVNIAYWTAGGALVGVGVGAVEVMTRESRQEAATSFMERKAGTAHAAAFVPTFVNARF